MTVERSDDVAATVQVQHDLRSIGVRRARPLSFDTIGTDGFHLHVSRQLVLQASRVDVAPALADIVRTNALRDDLAYCEDFRIAHGFLLFWLGTGIDILPANLRNRQLKKAGEVENRGVFLVPANIPAAILWPCLIDRAAAVFAKELASREAALDPLAAFTSALHNVAFFELAHGQLQEFGQAADVVAADLNIA